MHDAVSDLARRAVSRRTVMAGALAAPFVIDSRRVQAAQTFVLGTWGGDYQRLMMENIELPLVRKLGIESVADIAPDETVRASKILASRRLPKAPMDVACVSAVQGFLLGQAGVLEELTPDKVPNIAKVKNGLATSTFAPHIWSPQIISYNPERVKSPPTTFGELLDAKYKDRFGFPSGNFFYAMMAASLAESGTTTEFAKARETMTKLNSQGMRLYPTTDSAGPPFKTGELDVGVMWLARIAMWQNAGIPVAASFPKEGCILYVSGMVIPKNAPNKEAAFAYLNAMLEPQAQLGFAQNMGYLPTVTNATLTGKVAEQLALPNPAPKMVSPDYEVTAKALPGESDWWKKSIEHA
jgi:putative spermidine/putrescine transport system substrate-binding protein